MIVFQCNECAQHLRTKDHLSGKSIRCPKCTSLVKVPELTPQSVAATGQLDQPTIPPATSPASTQPEEAATIPPKSSDISQTDTETDATAFLAETNFGGVAIGVPGYEILSELGRGGMGVIYKARQAQPRRLVALKMILSAGYANAEQLARFQSEAEAVARIQHPNIVAIHNVSEHQGRPYLALEYVDGGNLAQYLKENELNAKMAAVLVRTLALAISKAHKKGIIHRDLKPANILLSTREESDDGLPFRIKVADFGLAKQIEDMASVAPGGAHTRTGAIMGTPSYMAPEQAAGKTKGITPATDVYALGAILYELLTGKPPFQGGPTIELLLRVTQDDPPPPRQVRSEIPRDLETICLKCLQKDPTKRYETARDLADDLDRYLNGEAISARPQGMFERFSRWLTKRKEIVYLGIGSLAALCLIAFAIVLNGLGAGSNQPSQRQPVVNTNIPTSTNQTSMNPGVIQKIRAAAAKTTSQNNLKQIGLALHSYHDAHGYLPPPAIYDSKGQPLLSWRVAILPYVEQDKLYKQFRLNERWDSPHNKQFLNRIPPVYEIPWGPNQGSKSLTCYQAFVGPGTAFEPTVRLNRNGVLQFQKRLRLEAFPDGTSNTIGLAEAAKPVPWTKPEDLRYDPKGPLPKLGGPFRKEGWTNVLLMDGSTKNLDLKKISPQTLRNAIERNDRNVLPSNWETGGGRAAVSSFGS